MFQNQIHLRCEQNTLRYYFVMSGVRTYFEGEIKYSLVYSLFSLKFIWTKFFYSLHSANANNTRSYSVELKPIQSVVIQNRTTQKIKLTKILCKPFYISLHIKHEFH